MSVKSLLVVEDEVLVARDIKARLTRMGYNVLDTAMKGQEAVEKALALKPDLILMDIHLADEIDGIEAAIRIKKELDVPVIFCTAYADEETLDRAKISEPFGYVLKPFDNRELEINIEIALYKHQVERDLSSTRSRLDATLTSISDGVVVTNTEGDICMINPMAEKITGWCKQKTQQMKLSDLMPLSPFPHVAVFDTRTIDVQDKVMNLRQHLRTADGGQLPIEVSTNAIDSEQEQLIVITFRDISKQMEYEEQIRRSAFYDDLTELPNRTLFINRLERSIKRRKRGANQQFAVAFLDLDGFAAINEGLGHEVGDEVLMEISSRITQTIRPDDTISRFSSKVFAVLFDPIDSAAGGIQACERIQRAVDKPIEIGSKVLNVSASAGILVNQDVYETAEEMVRDADTALHRAKSQAVGSYAIFNNEMYESALQFLERKSSMQQALEDGDFEVYYQPIIDVATEQLVSMEALVRWRHPKEGMVPPSEFIPIAERTGFILALGEFVLLSVCQQIKRWSDTGFNGFRVAVNLSGRQFETDVASMVGRIIQETGIRSGSLALEITEGIAMKNIDRNIKVMEDLRDLGLSISVDDFGTGYSSLASLKRFPFNTLKIDQSFICDITTNEDDREITRAIIAMGQSLRLKVLAEGVETDDQVEILRESGCDYIQGYHYSRPLPAVEVVAYLQERNLV